MSVTIAIAIKLSRQRVESLYELYEWMIGQYAPQDNYEHLLFSHITALYWRMEVLLKKQFETTSFHFTEPEAMAFVLFWGGWKVDDAYANLIVTDMIGKIDKRAKEPKTAKHGTKRKKLKSRNR